jgi:hypothetical protein
MKIIENHRNGGSIANGGMAAGVDNAGSVIGGDVRWRRAKRRQSLALYREKASASA